MLQGMSVEISPGEEVLAVAGHAPYTWKNKKQAKLLHLFVSEVEWGPW